jgi:hypothetical protein
MALNYDLSNIKYYKRLYKKTPEGKFKMDDVFHTLILSTMPVGMSSITEENYEKFYARLHLLETIHGSFFYQRKRGKLVARNITKDQVKRMIGLKVNVSELTANKFMKRFEKTQI